jgi:hypothetical protein
MCRPDSVCRVASPLAGKLYFSQCNVGSDCAIAGTDDPTRPSVAICCDEVAQRGRSCTHACLRRSNSSVRAGCADLSFHAVSESASYSESRPFLFKCRRMTEATRRSWRTGCAVSATPRRPTSPHICRGRSCMVPVVAYAPAAFRRTSRRRSRRHGKHKHMRARARAHAHMILCSGRGGTSGEQRHTSSKHRRQESPKLPELS